MKIGKYFYSLVCFMALPAFATSAMKMKFNEISITNEEAIKAGIEAEVTDVADRRGMYEFRVAVPESIRGNRIKHISAELFNSEQNIASFSLSSYSMEKETMLSSITGAPPKKQNYFYAQINPKVVKRVLLNIFCENNSIFIVEEKL